jgi:hypothetical protein
LDVREKEGLGKQNKTQNRQPPNLYNSPNFIKVIKLRRIRWAGHVVCTKEVRNAHKNLVTNTARKRPLARRWYNIIKADHEKIPHETVDWI